MALSDMMKHYFQIKERYPDCIIFYRLGDFYEMFFDDAKEASSLLELTLTGRDCGLEERAPMCGIPAKACDAYIAKLVSFGKKVAICEQLTEAGAQKGLVVRDVIRVVTSGTVTDDSSIDTKTNNFIACVSSKNGVFGISWADITTGTFYAQELVGSNMLVDAIFRINPAEIICDKEAFSIYQNLQDGVKESICKFSEFRDSAFSASSYEKILKEKFGVVDLSVLLPIEKVEAFRSAGALLAYLKDTQMHALQNISSISYYDDGKFLYLDQTALKNLEITKSMRDGKPFGSLLWAVDFTKTAGGGRKIKEVLLSPLRNIEKINYRLDGVEDLFSNNHARESLCETLKSVHDIERLAGKVSNNVVTPRDCGALLSSLNAVPSLKFNLLGMKSQIIKDIVDGMGDFDALCDLLQKALIDENLPISVKDGGFIKRGFDEHLDELYALKTNASGFIKEMEEREREQTGIRTLKINYNKVFGYYIEVSKSFIGQVPYTYVRKQTLVNGERYITEELKKFEEQILTCNESIIRIENEIFNKIKTVLLDHLQKILKCAKCVSMLDVLLSFATVAKSRNYVRPEIVDYGNSIDIVGGRHPVVEAGGKIKFIPNDTYLNASDNSMMIITGPNMAGKSTYMRQVALICILAHAGAFVPAKSAIIPLIDKIFTRVGASDNLMFDQSTFMVEMAEVANILRNATKDSLLILDEVGRGTSTFDGLSIAWAVVEYLATKLKAKTLFATHYHELSELEQSLEGVKNYKVTVKEINGSIVFLRKIMLGSANKSFGIEVANFAGVPKDITNRAKKILKSLEKNDLVIKGDLSSKTQEEKVDSEVEKYIKSLDLNNVSPMKAFEILAFLKEKLDVEN